MKKTFKRAGVAVLSMAMLLSMGAATALTSNAASVSIKSSSNGSTEAVTTTYQYFQLASATKVGDHPYTYTMAVDTVLSDDVSKALSKFIYKDTDNQIKAKAMTDGTTSIANATSLNSITDKSAEAKLLASKLAGAVTKTGTAITQGGSAVTLNPGYYLLVDTANKGEPILLSVTDQTTIELEPKATDIPFNKVITTINAANSTDNRMDSTTGGAKTGIADTGATVTYNINTQFPVYDSTTVTSGTNITDFEITDSPEDSLNIIRKLNSEDANNTGITVTVTKAGSPAVVTNAVEGTDYTVSDFAARNYTADTTKGDAAGDAGGLGFKITFTDSFVIAHRGEDVKVQFAATVTADPDTNSNPNRNTSKVKYSNDWYTGVSSTPSEQDSEASVYTTLFKVDKVDENGAALAGATFKIYSDSACTNEVGTLAPANAGSVTLGGTTANAEYSFTGLGEGNYWIKETTPPTGYQSNNTTYAITITANQTSGVYAGSFTYTGGDTAIDKNDATKGTNNIKTVVNTPNENALPGTGGMGTTLFTVGGAAVVLLAGFLFVVYMRKRKVEE